MAGTNHHYVQAVDSTTGTIREEDGPFVSLEDAHDRADELRAKWTLTTKVSVVSRVEDERRA